MGTQSPKGFRTRTIAYHDFQGLDSSRDITGLDTGNRQHLWQLNNATCDWRGQITRDPILRRLPDSDSGFVDHLRFSEYDLPVWVERFADGHRLKTTNTPNSFEWPTPKTDPITSTTFGGRLYFMSGNQNPVIFDGVNFAQDNPALNRLRPAFCTTIQRRLVVAGVSDDSRRTRVHLSRVDNASYFADEEQSNSTNVLRGGYIDIGNIIGNGDEITGLGSFEQNRLVIFTRDRALIYHIDPEIDRWSLDDRANIQVGCISHNSIVNAGTDLLFCSRDGIHSIKRSEENGILVYSYSLSDKIDILYRRLFNSVPTQQDVSSVFDKDTAQLHTFFPHEDVCTRLVLALNPEGGRPSPKFSVGNFGQVRCGDFLGGKLMFGGIQNVYEVMKVEDLAPNTSQYAVPNMEIILPYLWHGSLDQTKEVVEITVQAAGRGTLIIEAKDDNLIDSDTDDWSRPIQVEKIVVDSGDDSAVSSVPLSKQYHRSWAHQYRAAQYRIRSEGTEGGLLRVTGLAVTVREQGGRNA